MTVTVDQTGYEQKLVSADHVCVRVFGRQIFKAANSLDPLASYGSSAVKYY
jgi:hypothetical protein